MSDSPAQSEPAPASGRPGRWFVWVALALVAGVFVYSSWFKSAEPAAFTWADDYETALADAARNNKLVLLDFYATWCGPCKTLDREVFPRKDVGEALGGWIAVKIDAEKEEELAHQYRIDTYPTLIALSPNGDILHGIKGAPDADRFIRWIEEVERKRAGEGHDEADAAPPELREMLEPTTTPAGSPEPAV